MTTKFFNKKTLIILDSDSTFPEKVSNYISHSTRFSEILPELIKESNQKIASRHLKATFVETGSLCDYDPLLRWRNLEVNRLFGLFSASDNRVALSKFNQLEEKFTEKPDIVELKNEILNENIDVRKSLLISKQYWGKIETHGFYDEMITRFAKLCANFSMTELSFFSYFISMDESGVLFLFHKFIYTCLKCKLASQLIVALYKPGAFIAFFDRVVKLLWWKLDIIKNNVPFTITKSTAYKVVGFSGLGLTLFSSIYLKPVASLQQNPLYTGFSGDLGFVFNNLRHYSSQLVFEFTKTISHITNAAVAGFIAPKEEAIRSYIRSIIKK